MEKFVLDECPTRVRSKNSSREAVRFTANLFKRDEVDAMRRSNQEKLRASFLICKPIHFTQGVPQSDYVVPEGVKAEGIQICAEELGSTVEGHDIKKLQYHGGANGLAGKLSASITDGLSNDTNFLNKRQKIYGINKLASKARSFWVFVWEALQAMTLMILGVCALVKSPPSPYEGANQSAYFLSRSLAAQATDNVYSRHLMSHQSRRNSHSRNNFYPGRPVPSAVFFNVNIFNFSLESISRDGIFAPLITVLLGFLQSSGTSPSPSELHPTVFKVSVGFSASYFLAIAAKFLFPGFASQFGILMSVFGSLAAASLISLTLRLPWWSIFFILLSIGGLFKLLNKLHATYGTMHRPPLLPLEIVRFNY